MHILMRSDGVGFWNNSSDRCSGLSREMCHIAQKYKATAQCLGDDASLGMIAVCAALGGDTGVWDIQKERERENNSERGPPGFLLRLITGTFP